MYRFCFQSQLLQRLFTATTISLTYILLLNQHAIASEGYTVNGLPVAPEMQQLLAFYGFKPGTYYVDAHGNYGESGAPPTGNLDGGPARGWSGREPQGVQNNPYAQAYINGVSGTRIFWVYSPSIFSDATGGASGYYHICPNNVYYTSSEGATNVGGGYNSQTGGNNPWGGVAGTTSGGGRWSVQSSPNGPLLNFNGSDGSHQVLLTTLLQGSFTVGRTKYAVEANKAQCPR